MFDSDLGFTPQHEIHRQFVYVFASHCFISMYSEYRQTQRRREFGLGRRPVIDLPHLELQLNGAVCYDRYDNLCARVGQGG